MDKHERRRRMAIGIGFIEEVFYDVLKEARENDKGTLTRQEFVRGSGLHIPDVDPRFDGQARRYILDVMAEKGQAVNDSPGGGADSWRLPG